MTFNSHRLLSLFDNINWVILKAFMSIINKHFFFLKVKFSLRWNME